MTPDNRQSVLNRLASGGFWDLRLATWGEDEMCSFGGDGFTDSPDRLEALVWAVWALMLDTAAVGVRCL